MIDDVRRRIRVVDESGSPVEGATVVVEWSDVPFPEIALVTDQEGSTQLLLPDGHFRISAYAEDSRQGVENVVGGTEGGIDDIRISVVLTEAN